MTTTERSLSTRPCQKWRSIRPSRMASGLSGLENVVLFICAALRYPLYFPHCHVCFDAM